MSISRYTPGRCAASVLALLLVPAAVPAADLVAEGTVKIEEVEWTVADVMAWQDDDQVEVVLSDQPFDRAAMMEDGELDVFDFMRHDGNRLAINLAEDGPTMCVDFTTHVGDTTSSGSSCNSDFPDAITISSRTAERVAGSMQWASGEESVDVRFDVPVEAAP